MTERGEIRERERESRDKWIFDPLVHSPYDAKAGWRWPGPKPGGASGLPQGCSGPSLPRHIGKKLVGN